MSCEVKDIQEFNERNSYTKRQNKKPSKNLLKGNGKNPLLYIYLWYSSQLFN